jgi:L-lactate dehydrogenase complex protein LldF
MKKYMSKGMQHLFLNPSCYRSALKFAPIVNHLPRPLIYNGLNAWGKGREIPKFANETFEQLWKKGKVKNN